MKACQDDVNSTLEYYIVMTGLSLVIVNHLASAKLRLLSHYFRTFFIYRLYLDELVLGRIYARGHPFVNWYQGGIPKNGG